MPSKTEIANGALRLVGAGRVTNVDTDGTPKAQTVLDLYEDVRKELLRSHNWNFATKREKLAQSSTTPEFEFDYAYPIPSDWIRTKSVTDNDAGYSTILYRMEFVGSQRCIVCSADQVYLRYIFNAEDPNKYSADFVRAFELLLGRDLALPITASRTLRADLDAEYKRVISQAKSTDSQGQFPELRPRGSWANSRRGFRNDDFLND